jgi:hypothetical protein
MTHLTTKELLPLTDLTREQLLPPGDLTTICPMVRVSVLASKGAWEAKGAGLASRITRVCLRPPGQASLSPVHPSLPNLVNER